MWVEIILLFSIGLTLIYLVFNLAILHEGKKRRAWYKKERLRWKDVYRGGD